MDSAVARRFAYVAAVLSAVAALSAQQAGTLDPDAEFVSMRAAAKQSYDQREWERSTSAYQLLLNAARAKGSPLWEGRALLGLGRVAEETSHYDDARRQTRDALEIFLRLNATNDV